MYVLRVDMVKWFNLSCSLLCICSKLLCKGMLKVFTVYQVVSRAQWS